MKCKIITDIAKIKDNVYYFKLDGVSYVAELTKTKFGQCERCRLFENKYPNTKCRISLGDRTTGRALCVVLSDSMSYNISDMIRGSLIIISKFRNGR